MDFRTSSKVVDRKRNRNRDEVQRERSLFIYITL